MMAKKLNRNVFEKLVKDLLDYEENMDKGVEAAMALGEVDNQDFLPELIKLAKHEDTFVREAVAVPIFNIERMKSLPILLRILKKGHTEGFDCDTLQTLIGDAIQSNKKEAKDILDKLERSEPEFKDEIVWASEFTK